MTKVSLCHTLSVPPPPPQNTRRASPWREAFDFQMPNGAKCQMSNVKLQTSIFTARQSWTELDRARQMTFITRPLWRWSVAFDAPDGIPHPARPGVTPGPPGFVLHWDGLDPALTRSISYDSLTVSESGAHRSHYTTDVAASASDAALFIRAAIRPSQTETSWCIWP